ncbi:MAG: hypothetical protein CMQ40_10780 [Gammaproteobacteria bacterium]|nr:hypothetical protein [Gammaproteobacteria bacterium]
MIDQLENIRTKPAAVIEGEDEVEFVSICSRTPSGIEFTIYLPRDQAEKSVKDGAFTFVLCEPRVEVEQDPA